MDRATVRGVAIGAAQTNFPADRNEYKCFTALLLQFVLVLHLRNGERNMNKQMSQESDHLLYWIVAVLLIVSVGLADAGIVALSASLITFAQLAVFALTVALIDSGVFFTAWLMRR